MLSVGWLGRVRSGIGTNGPSAAVAAASLTTSRREGFVARTFGISDNLAERFRSSNHIARTVGWATRPHTDAPAHARECGALPTRSGLSASRHCPNRPPTTAPLHPPTPAILPTPR